MDGKYIVGLAPGYANTDTSVRAPVAARDSAVGPALPGVDHHNVHEHKYSNKNWNQHQRYPSSTGWPSPQTLQTLDRVVIHPQSDLVDAPRRLQLDPSQSLKRHHSQHRLQGPSPSLLQQQKQPSLASVVSSTHPHPDVVHSSQTRQPYRNPSQPPRLPPLAVSLSDISLSPFDPPTTREGVNYFLSAAASPTPATSDAVLSVPRLPVQADDIVSPISETRSSTPIFRSWERGDEASAHSPAGQPFTHFTALNRQPTTHSSAGYSVLDDREFERSLGAADTAEHPAASPSRSVFAAVKNAVAHDVAHLTDERSDDWFRYTARASTISRYTNHSHPESHHMMAAAMTGDEPSMPSMPAPPQQSGQFISTTTSTFTPLPPIRRTSTFDLLRKKSPDDDSDTVPSPIEKDIPPLPSGAVETVQQAIADQLSAVQGASRSSPHDSLQPHLQSNLNLNSNPHGHSHPPIPPQPNGPVPVAAPPGQPGMPQPPIVQMHPHQMMMGRGGPAGQQVAPGHMMINDRGQTVISLPGGRQWTVQESHLDQELNPSNRNRSANSPQPYAGTAYDKEIGEGPPPSHLAGAPSHPFPTRPRNASNPMPPTSAMRYPLLFPRPGQQQASLRDQGQVPLPQHPLLRGQNGSARPRDSFDDGSLSKETMGVRVDQLRVDQGSLSSVASEDANDKQRRGSGSLFNLGHRRTSTVAATQQGSADAVPEKKKKNLFASVANMAHSQQKPKSNLGPNRTQTFDNSEQVSLPNQGENVPPKKRLSELKGMIMGVGNAKEGAKDDQPVKVETIYESRHSMQSPPSSITAPPGIQGVQNPPTSLGPPSQPEPFRSQEQTRPSVLPGSMQPHPLPTGQAAATNQPAFVGVGRASTAGPQLGQSQQVKSEESMKKSSSGGFLGGLFHKQGNKAKEAKPQPIQQTPSGQRPTQPLTQPGYVPFRPGQVGQPLGPHPMFAGQPQIQRGPPGQSPSPPLFQDPSQPAPSLQKAQMITIRRPSGLTVSSTQSTNGAQPPSNERPSMPSPQGSQGTLKQQSSSPLGQKAGQTGLQNDANIVASQTSPRLSEDSPLGPAAGTAASMTRFAPNRKPVGSGNSRDGPFMTSAVPPAATRPEGATSPSPKVGEQRAPSQLSQVHPSSHAESPGGLNSVRQPSLPSPIPSPVPSQSNQSSSPRLQGDQLAHNSPGLRESGQGLGVFQSGLSPTSPINASGPNGAPNGLSWGPNVARPSVPPLTSPPAAARAQPPHTPSSPVPSVDQGKLSRFFGAYDGGKPATQPQASKEKSAASKFLGAFKRSSKQQSEAPTSQPCPQTSPQIAQQPLRPAVPNLVATGATPNSGGTQAPPNPQTGQMWIPPVQPGQGRGLIPMPMSTQQMQGGRGQPGQIPPQGIPMAMRVQVGRGQIPPGMIVQAGRGQLPPSMMMGPGPVPPHLQRPVAPEKQGNEPVYDQVPIPRGYETVHAAGSILAPSPYNAGRPGHQPIQYAQLPPTSHPGFLQRQWDPRLMQSGPLPGAPPGAPQFVPQGVTNNIPYQGPPQQPQPQGLSQNSSPIPQNPNPSAAQNQVPSQQFAQSQLANRPSQVSPSGQGQIPTQGAQNPQTQQSQPSVQGFQQKLTPGPQTLPNMGWTGTPQNRQSPLPIQQPTPAPNPAPQASATSGSPASSATSSSQSQHISQTTQVQLPQSGHPNSTHQASPINRIPDSHTQTPSQETSGPLTQSAPVANGLLQSPDAARLTSRMSVSRQASSSRDMSFNPANPIDRALAVSPEPPGRQHHGPIHQVSEQTLGVDVQRANSHARHASEDIYDATPRLNSTSPVVKENGNTKYAGSEKSRGLMNSTTVGAGDGAAGVAVGATDTTAAVVAEDNMSFLDGPDSDPDSTSTTTGSTTTGGERAGEETKGPAAVSPPQPPAPTVMNTEPEEKILVDLPVELAAVNDDDDGIPMMTATSYPGQEWNPYGAGEFGDWE